VADSALNGKRGTRALNKDQPAPGSRRDWAPEVKQVDGARHHGSTWELLSGQTYKISGRRFNGMTQSASYSGGSQQSATNYPLVRITNDSSGHVVYCRTHDHSGMAVASEREVSTFFDIPSTIETGPCKLEVVTNGIPPAPNRSKSTDSEAGEVANALSLLDHAAGNATAGVARRVGPQIVSLSVDDECRAAFVKERVGTITERDAIGDEAVLGVALLVRDEIQKIAKVRVRSQCALGAMMGVRRVEVAAGRGEAGCFTLADRVDVNAMLAGRQLRDLDFDLDSMAYITEFRSPDFRALRIHYVGMG